MSDWRYDSASGSFRQSNNNRGKNDGSWISWGFIILGFVVWWPIGLALLIAKLNDSSTKKPAQRSATRVTPERSDASAADTSARQKAKMAESKVAKAARSITKSPNETSGTSRVLQIVGAAAMAVFGVGLLSMAGEALGDGWLDWSGILSLVGFFAGGAVAFFYGRKMQRRQNRIARYHGVMGERDYVSLGELMAVTGRKYKTVERDVEHMIQRGMLGTGAFVDSSRGVLFRSADAYQRYLTERTKTENLTPKEANEGYSGALRAIRGANDRIPDPVFSEKLDHMEQIAGKIFREVEAHPEKQKQAATFFDYYLPTTLKLLGTYTEFEEAGIEGENLRQAKARIESIMDNLLVNFERQLDELYRSEAMDVDADIRVMETMLTRDLSSVERDFGLSGSTAAVKQPPDME